MKKILICFAFMAPFFTSAAVFTPADVKNVYYVEDGKNYEIHLFLKAGNFYRFGEVQYEDSRYLLLEDTARAINNHRNFTGFDDDDLVYLLDGVVPYTNNDIQSVDISFTDTDVTIVAKFFAGGGFTINNTYDQKFLVKKDVADYVVDLINKQDGFEGEYKAEQILEQYEVFDGITYYAPEVRSIEISYDTQEQLFVADVVFENEAIKKYAIFPKDTQRKIVVDTASRINEFYQDFEEEGSVTPDLVEEIATWKNIPIFIDEIESITVQRKDEETIYLLVRIPSEEETTETLFETQFNEDFTQREELSITIAELFDKSPNFGSDFDLLTLTELTLIGDIDLSKFTQIESIDSTTTEESSEEQPTIPEDTPEPVLETSTAQESVTPTEQDKLLEQIIAIIIQIIAESGLDLDISSLVE